MSMPEPTSSRVLHLPFGIRITVDPSGDGELESNLFQEFREDDEPSEDAVARAGADAMEGLLLALACAGIDLETAACREAIVTAVESFAQPL